MIRLIVTIGFILMPIISLIAQDEVLHYLDTLEEKEYYKYGEEYKLAQEIMRLIGDGCNDKVVNHNQYECLFGSKKRTKEEIKRIYELIAKYPNSKIDTDVVLKSTYSETDDSVVVDGVHFIYTLEKTQDYIDLYIREDRFCLSVHFIEQRKNIELQILGIEK